jgi:hypothetical protein
VAEAHAADMAATNFFNHYSQNGSSPYDRIKAAFPSITVVSELIAAGWTDVRSVMLQFMWSAHLLICCKPVFIVQCASHHFHIGVLWMVQCLIALCTDDVTVCVCSSAKHRNLLMVSCPAMIVAGMQ